MSRHPDRDDTAHSRTRPPQTCKKSPDLPIPRPQDTRQQGALLKTQPLAPRPVARTDSAPPQDGRPVHFHAWRGNRWTPTTTYGRVWAALDGRPLPPGLDRVARACVRGVRRARFAYGAMRSGPPAHETPPVTDDGVLPAPGDAEPPDLDALARRFAEVHEANEALARPDGSWDPQPFRGRDGRGVAVEEAALRVPGYLGAFDATGEPEYLRRAERAGDHILRSRLFADGHLLLQDHLAPDLPYSFAGAALLDLWRRSPSERGDHLRAASLIGDRLLEYPVSGSVNHACCPAWLLAPLYRATGDARYLRGAVRRVTATAVPFQLPHGGWAGHESWSCYHGIITKALVVTYTAVPFFPRWYGVKDRLARAIVRALNHFVVAQGPTGRIEPRGPLALDREVEERGRAGLNRARLSRGRFVRSGSEAVDPDEGYEMDAWVTAHLELGVAPDVAHGMGRWLAGRTSARRYEMETYAVGRYLGLRASLRAAGGARPSEFRPLRAVGGRNGSGG